MNWHQRVEAAIGRGRFTKKDKADAESWGRCAIGEKIGATSSLKVLSDSEVNLGMQFYHFVKQDKVAAARRVLEQIEALPA